jgi:drug/metabolite transporter (DMT)-like permease
MSTEGVSCPGTIMNDARRQGQVGRATAMLVLTTVLWGLSFPLMKQWQNAAAAAPGGPLLAGLTMIALRMTLGLLVLFAWQPRLVTAPNRREHARGAAIGAVFFFGFSLQVWGLASTSPALSAFFTSLCSAWVPLLVWLVVRVVPRPLNLLGLIVGLTGTVILGLGSTGSWVPGRGEALTLAASVLFAGQVLLVDRLGRNVRPGGLTAGFFGITIVLAWTSTLLLAALKPGLSTWASWTVSMLHDPDQLRDLALLTLLPTVLAFHWMNTYQPRVAAGRAALIYLLEPIFSSIFSVSWGHDQLTRWLLLGGSLVLAGNLLVELPRLFSARTITPGEEHP